MTWMWERLLQIQTREIDKRNSLSHPFPNRSFITFIHSHMPLSPKGIDGREIEAWGWVSVYWSLRKEYGDQMRPNIRTRTGTVRRDGVWAVNVWEMREKKDRSLTSRSLWSLWHVFSLPFSTHCLVDQDGTAMRQGTGKGKASLFLFTMSSFSFATACGMT